MKEVQPEVQDIRRRRDWTVKRIKEIEVPKIIEKEGFEAVYLSGFGQSASHLGLPDAGLMSFSEIGLLVRPRTSCLAIRCLTGWRWVLTGWLSIHLLELFRLVIARMSK